MTSLLPPEFNTVTLSGQYVNLDGTPVAGYLTFTPSPTILKAAASKDLIVPVTINVNLDGTGHFSIALPATDDPDINPDHWTYAVLEAFGSRRTYSVQILLENGSSQNIFDLAPVSLANGTFYEIGPTGPAGPPALVVSGAPAGAVGGTGDYAIDPVAGILYGPKDQVTGWGSGVHLAATDIAAHAALTHTHGLQPGSNLVGTTDTQTLSGKTLQAPTITGGVSLDTLSTSGDAAVGGVLTVAGALTGHAIAGTSVAVTSGTVTAAPNGVNDLVNKAYADGLGQSPSAGNTIVRRDAGGWFAASMISLSNSPVNSSDVTTKSYVDGQDLVIRRYNATTIAASYVLAAGDEHTLLRCNSASAITVTVPPNSVVGFPVGAVIELTQSGAGQLSLIPGAGVTINAPDGALSTRVQHSRIRIIKVAADTWSTFGDLNTPGAQLLAGATSAATVSTLVKRDGAGSAVLQALTLNAAPVNASDAVRKDYVDNNFTNIGGGIAKLLLNEQSADPATPSTAGQDVLWKANDHGLYVVGQNDTKRRLKMHWGSGVGPFPSTGVIVGDTYFRTDVGTNGSMWVYTGGSTGITGWTSDAPVVCTSGVRPSVTYAGFMIFETDTKLIWAHDGSAYRLLNPDGTTVNTAAGTFTVPTSSASPSVLTFSTLVQGSSAGWASANPTRLLPYAGAGYYELVCYMAFGANGTGTRGVSLRVTGGSWIHFSVKPTCEASFGYQTTETYPGLQLAATDYVEVGLWQNSTVTQTLNGGNQRVTLRRTA